MGDPKDDIQAKSQLHISATLGHIMSDRRHAMQQFLFFSLNQQLSNFHGEIPRGANVMYF